jgi:nucleoside-diphosphate-sugar epimerase
MAYYADAAGIRAVTLSLFDSYGPGDTRKKFLRLLLDCLETNGELQMSPGDQVLDLAHVDDICEAFLHAARLVRDPNHPSLACYAVGGERMTFARSSRPWRKLPVAPCASTGGQGPTARGW